MGWVEEADYAGYEEAGSCSVGETSKDRDGDLVTPSRRLG